MRVTYKVLDGRHTLLFHELYECNCHSIVHTPKYWRMDCHVWTVTVTAYGLSRGCQGHIRDCSLNLGACRGRGRELRRGDGLYFRLISCGVVYVTSVKYRLIANTKPRKSGHKGSVKRQKLLQGRFRPVNQSTNQSNKFI